MSYVWAARVRGVRVAVACCDDWDLWVDTTVLVTTSVEPDFDPFPHITQQSAFLELFGLEVTTIDRARDSGVLGGEVEYKPTSYIMRRNRMTRTMLLPVNVYVCSPVVMFPSALRVAGIFSPERYSMLLSMIALRSLDAVHKYLTDKTSQP